MVESEVAVKLDTEQMFDKDANVVTDEKLMGGRPTKHQLVHPEQMIFVDKTGCNTNQKDDAYAGGEVFLLPQEKEDGEDFGNVGTATDIDHTVLTLTNALGVPFLCAIILKSDQDITEIPINWKLGIDILKNLDN
jgi:hypothetical protein